MNKPLLLLLCLVACDSGLVPGGPDDTGPADTGEEPDGPELVEAKLLIEHNATDGDTGFQLFLDGDPWSRLLVTGPEGDVIEIDARGDLAGLGLTEGFFETEEPSEGEVPLADVLARFPAGDYRFEATSAEDGSTMVATARLTHTIPAEPNITAPMEDEIVPADDLVITWEPVTTSLDGEPLSLVGYQVIVVVEEDQPPSDSLFQDELSVFLPASATSLAVPEGFLVPGTAYEVEVLAIEPSGNQTIGLRVFETVDTD